jgi:hypothetical protein
MIGLGNGTDRLMLWPEVLSLTHYEKLTEHGFALPCFTQMETGNASYVARALLPGDPKTVIASFDFYHADVLCDIPKALQRQDVEVGDPWIDVFLWDRRAYVGTKPDIWEMVKPRLPEIRELAPLSALGLAEGVSTSAAAPIGQVAFAWLQMRIGDAGAVRWLDHTYFRGIAVRTLRRVLSEKGTAPAILGALQELRINRNGSDLVLRVPPAIASEIGHDLRAVHDLQIAASPFALKTIRVEPTNASGPKERMRRARPPDGNAEAIAQRDYERFVNQQVSTAEMENFLLSIMPAFTSGAQLNWALICESNEVTAAFQRLLISSGKVNEFGNFCLARDAIEWGYLFFFDTSKSPYNLLDSLDRDIQASFLTAMKKIDRERRVLG